jgi:polar amino acid transport system substrate-binding protein
MNTICNILVNAGLSVSLRQICAHYRLSSIFLFLCLPISVTNSLADTTITLNAGTAEPFITEDGGGFYGVLTREIFSRIGIDAKVIRLPSARSIINANEGIDDGVIARTAGMEEKYENLIRIPVTVVTFRFVAYSRDKEIQITGWDSFAPYSVGYIRGWRIYEKNLTKAKSLTIVNNAEQLFRLLMNGRTDLIMFEYYRGTWWNKHLNANAHIIGSPVAKKDMFMYMHKKHKDLVPKIIQAFEAVKQDGTYQRIKNETLPEYIK